MNRTEQASVDLYWLPLGAGPGFGNRWVRLSGRVYEALAARAGRREPCHLYHSALKVGLGSGWYTIEMAPVWRDVGPDGCVVAEGPVGLPWLGWSRFFRYEVRCWRNGVIPDECEAVSSPQRLSADAERARRLLQLVPQFPTTTWGLDELHAGEMWNSNSLISWLLARSGHDTAAVQPPDGGRAPGWRAGLVVAARQPGVPVSAADPASGPRPLTDAWSAR